MSKNINLAHTDILFLNVKKNKSCKHTHTDTHPYTQAPSSATAQLLRDWLQRGSVSMASALVAESSSLQCVCSYTSAHVFVCLWIGVHSFTPFWLWWLDQFLKNLKRDIFKTSVEHHCQVIQQPPRFWRDEADHWCFKLPLVWSSVSLSPNPLLNAACSSCMRNASQSSPLLKEWWRPFS